MARKLRLDTTDNFLENENMGKKIFSLIAVSVLLQALLCACDMSAIIMNKDTPFSCGVYSASDSQFADFTTPQDYLAYVMSRSNASTNNDGYGILYYSQDSFVLKEDNYYYKYVHSYQEHGNVWYTGNYFNEQNQPDIFDIALKDINDPDNRATIVMCHCRFASGYPFAPGNHPFHFNSNGRTYTLMHNGAIPNDARLFMISSVKNRYPFWFEQHQPNFPSFANSNNPAYWIDSEVLFHYLMSWIVDSGYNVTAGLYGGLKELDDFKPLTSMILNFIFSDGERLYAFRTTNLQTSHKLSYKSDPSGFCAVRTGEPTAGETQIKQGELIILSAGKTVEHHPEFLKETEFAYRHPATEQQDIDLRTAGNAVISNQHGINICFTLQEQTKVRITVYNSKGQKIRTLNDSILKAGTYNFNWDGTDKRRLKAAESIYYLEIVKGSERNIHRVYLHN